MQRVLRLMVVVAVGAIMGDGVLTPAISGAVPGSDSQGTPCMLVYVESALFPCGCLAVDLIDGRLLSWKARFLSERCSFTRG